VKVQCPDATLRAPTEQLSRAYRERWPDLIPVELHRLAWCLAVRIDPVGPLEGGARLVPVSGGFVVLVDRRLSPARYRTAVAHELAHTLFYSVSSSMPKRRVEHSKKEEYFCFDVARRLLAPKWVVEAIGLRQGHDAQEVFNALTSKLHLSRPVAARVMLDDHELAQGVAGRWRKDGGAWLLGKGTACASPSLSQEQRRSLRHRAHQWLTGQQVTTVACRVIGELNRTGESAFVVVVLDGESKR
jgi:hypothetical protein